MAILSVGNENYAVGPKHSNMMGNAKGSLMDKKDRYLKKLENIKFNLLFDLYVACRTRNAFSFNCFFEELRISYPLLSYELDNLALIKCHLFKGLYLFEQYEAYEKYLLSLCNQHAPQSVPFNGHEFDDLNTLNQKHSNIMSIAKGICLNNTL